MPSRSLLDALEDEEVLAQIAVLAKVVSAVLNMFC